LSAVFEVLAGDTAALRYRGCPLLNTSKGLPWGAHPAHLVAVNHKEQVRDWFHSRAANADARDPAQLADELLIPLDGTDATAAVLDDAACGQRALRLARLVIDDACAAPIHFDASTSSTRVARSCHSAARSTSERAVEV